MGKQNISMSAAKLVVNELLEKQEKHDPRALNAGKFTTTELYAIHKLAASGENQLLSLAAHVVYNAMHTFICAKIRQLKGVGQIEEMSQDAFIAVMTNLPRYNPEYALTTYLQPIIVNMVQYKNKKQMTAREREVRHFVKQARRELEALGCYLYNNETLLAHIHKFIDDSVTIEELESHEVSENYFQNNSEPSKQDIMIKTAVDNALTDMRKESVLDPTPGEISAFIEGHYGKHFSTKTISKYLERHWKTVSLTTVSNYVADAETSNPITGVLSREANGKLHDFIELLPPEQRDLIKIQMALYSENLAADGEHAREVSYKSIHKMYQKLFDENATLAQVRKTLAQAIRQLKTLLEGDKNVESARIDADVRLEFATSEEIREAVMEFEEIGESFFVELTEKGA